MRFEATLRAILFAGGIGFGAVLLFLFLGVQQASAEERRQRWTHPDVPFDAIEFNATPARFPWEVATSSQPIPWTEEGIHASSVRLPSDACYRLRARVVDEARESPLSALSNPQWAGNCPPPPILLIDVPEPPKSLGMAAGVWTLFGLRHFRLRARR